MRFGDALIGALDAKSFIAKVRILVVDDDSTCLTVISGMLKFVGYEVVTIQDPLQALSTLSKKSQKFDLVLSDIHMPSMNGFELQKHIQNEFNIPVIFMSGDDNRSIAMQGLKQGASFFILKPPKVYDLENLWQYIVTNNTSTSFGESIEKQSIEKPISCMGMLVNEPNEDELHSLSLTENEDNSCLNNHNKPKLIGASEDIQENEIESKRTSTNSKKLKKLVWTTSLHNKFLHAINIIGHDKAVPKKILEYMNVPGLTRENIASHLQKYRIYCRKNEESEKGSMENTRPFRSVLAWSQYPHSTTNNLLLNFPNVRRQVQPQPTQQPQFMPNLGSLNFGGSQSLMNNTQANINNNNINNNFVLPMNNNNHFGHSMNNHSNFVNPIMNNNNNFAHPMNNNIGPNVVYNHHAYGPNQLSIVESSMLGGQHNNQVVHNQMGFPVGLSSGFYQVGGSSTNNGLWNNLPPPGDEFWNLPLPGENNNLGGFVFDNNNNNIALPDNNVTFNGINIQQGINQLQLQGSHSTYIDPIVGNNQVVVDQQAFNMSNLNNTNNNIHVAHQQVPLVDNNDDDALQVIRPVEPNHEMSNIDLVYGSSSDYQDYASLNLDDPPLGGIDELFGFLSSNNNDLNNRSNNQLP